MDAAQRGAALTQRMLAFARRQELKPQRVNVPTLVAGMTELLQRALGRCSSRNELLGGLAAVSADINQLEMALSKLAVNARDAMPEGGPLSIRAVDATSRSRGGAP